VLHEDTFKHNDKFYQKTNCVVLICLSMPISSCCHSIRAFRLKKKFWLQLIVMQVIANNDLMAPSPRQHPSARPSGHCDDPWTAEIYSLSRRSWVCCKASSCWVQNTSFGLGLEGILTRCSNNLNAEEQWLYSEPLLGERAPHHIIRVSPATYPSVEAHFGHLYLQSHSFGQYQQLMTIREG